MKLYFNGCSHTFGDDLHDKSLSWPSLLGSKLNCQILNDSVSGGTNDRIMYRTVKNVHDFDFFCIAWTYTSRFTRYRIDNNYDVNFNPQLVHSLYKDAPEFKDYGKMHYAYWHNELYAVKLWLQNIVLLQRYLDSFKKPYVMISANHNHIHRWNVDRSLFNSSVKSLVCFDLMSDLQLDAEHTEIQLLISQIDHSRYIDLDSWYITQLCSAYPVGPTGHLLEEGHQAVANHILAHDPF
jgi:hypothetical protein